MHPEATSTVLPYLKLAVRTTERCAGRQHAVHAGTLRDAAVRLPSCSAARDVAGNATRATMAPNDPRCAVNVILQTARRGAGNGGGRARRRGGRLYGGRLYGGRQYTAVRVTALRGRQGGSRCGCSTSGRGRRRDGGNGGVGGGGLEDRGKWKEAWRAGEG